MARVLLICIGKSIIDRVGQADIIPTPVTCCLALFLGANLLMLKGILVFWQVIWVSID